MTFCLLLASLFFLISPLHGASFHAIITADTATSNIKESATKDFEHMRDAVRTITNRIGMPLKLSTLKGPKLTLRSLEKKISKLKVEKDDCLLFYFSGHGLGSRSGKSRWPIMHFKPKNEDIYLEKIEKALMKKKARLLIILCDSCNHFQDGHGASKERSSVHYGEPEVDLLLEAACYKTLFMKTKGKIIASGSLPGKTAWGTQLGGWFTSVFLRALETEPLKKNPSWKHVSKEITRLLKNSSEQVPQIKLLVKKK